MCFTTLFSVCRLSRYLKSIAVSCGGTEIALVIHQDPTGNWAGGNGATVWDAGLAMGAFLALEPVADEYIRGKAVVDVGSGTGFCGLVAAALGAQAVTMTDRRCALPLIKKNVAANAQVLEGIVGGQQLHVTQLEWGDTEAAAVLCGPLST